MRPSPRWPLLIAASALVLLLLVLTDTRGAPRLATALWCLLACPGMAVVPLLPPTPSRVSVGLVIGLSIAIETGVVTATLIAGSFSATVAALVLAGLCAAGCAAQLWIWARARPRPIVVLHV